MRGLHIFQKNKNEIPHRRRRAHSFLNIFESFYLPIKNSHESQKWLTRTRVSASNPNRLENTFEILRIYVLSFTFSWTFAESSESFAFIFKYMRLNVSFGCRTRQFLFGTMCAHYSNCVFYCPAVDEWTVFGGRHLCTTSTTIKWMASRTHKWLAFNSIGIHQFSISYSERIRQRVMIDQLANFPFQDWLLISICALEIL